MHDFEPRNLVFLLSLGVLPACADRALDDATDGETTAPAEPTSPAEACARFVPSVADCAYSPDGVEFTEAVCTEYVAGLIRAAPACAPELYEQLACLTQLGCAEVDGEGPCGPTRQAYAACRED